MLVVCLCLLSPLIYVSQPVSFYESERRLAIRAAFHRSVTPWSPQLLPPATLRAPTSCCTHREFKMAAVNLLVEFQDASLCISPCPVDLRSLEAVICGRAGLPCCFPLLLAVAGRPLDDTSYASMLSLGTDVAVRASLKGGLLGGKGGFGANLRSAGRSGQQPTSQNFNMCRDLSGRRLGTVNNELRLRKWLSPEEEARRKKLGDSYEEATGNAGVSGWFLSVPSWAEGIHKSNLGHEGTLTRRKTTLCKHWVEARARGPGTRHAHFARSRLSVCVERCVRCDASTFLVVVGVAEAARMYVLTLSGPVLVVP